MTSRNSHRSPAGRVPRSGALGLLLAVICLFQMVQPVVGQGPPGPVDQQQTNGAALLPVLVPNSGAGQTFTAGRTGNLDQADLFLQNLGLSENVVVQIRNAVGNLPGATILGTGTLAEANIPTFAASFVSVPLTTPAPVIAGTQYAIVVFQASPLAAGLVYGGGSPDPYLPGQFSFSTSGGSGPWFGIPAFDLAFRTYVTSPTLSVGTAQVAEGNSGTTNLVFPVPLSPTVGLPVTAPYTLANGTATGGAACGPGVDFVNTGGTVTIAANGTNGTITVPVCGETLVEPDETLTVTLGTPTNAVLGTATATGTIVNDDTAGLSINDVTQNEGSSGTTSFVFTVTLGNASAQVVTVQFATANGTATASSDYTATNGTLTFAPGVTTQTITVPVVGDTTVEPDETFFVNLTNATNATITDAQGLGTILNDDAAAPPAPPATADVRITKSGPATVTAGTNVIYTITVTNAGPGQTEGVVVTDPTPAGLTFVSNAGACTTTWPCALGAGPSGQARTITTTFNVPAGYGGPNPIANTTAVTSTTSDPTAANNTATATTSVVVAATVNDPNNDDKEEKPKETEDQRRNRERTNTGHRGDVTIEGNVIEVVKAPEINSLLVTIKMTRNETQVVQVPCFGASGATQCYDIQVGDYLEADGYQNGVGDPNSYFVAADGVEVTRNGKKVK